MSSNPQLSLSGCSSLFSLSSSSTDRDNDSAPAMPQRRPLLSLSVGGGGDEEEEGEEYLLGGLHLPLMGSGGSSCDGDDERKTLRMMRNRESALRSRARKRAYVQELEKEVRRLVNENLKLKRQCKLVGTAPIFVYSVIYSTPSTPSQSTISTWLVRYLCFKYLSNFNLRVDDAAESGDGCTDPAKQQQERKHQENLLLNSALAS